MFIYLLRISMFVHAALVAQVACLACQVIMRYANNVDSCKRSATDDKGVYDGRNQQMKPQLHSKHLPALTAIQESCLATTNPFRKQKHLRA